MNEELKPCPFCGGQCEVSEYPRPQWFPWYVVRCFEGDPCGALGSARRTKVEASAAWNARVDDGWRGIESAPIWQVAVVTDGERAAVAQMAEADYGGTYWAVYPDDCLDWEPTHWLPLPTPPATTGSR